MFPKIFLLPVQINLSFNSVIAQRALEKFIKALEKEGVINNKAFLGGKIVFENEFKKPKYNVYGKARLLQIVKKSKRPQTYKVYTGPGGKINNIYVVIPNSYFPYVTRKKLRPEMRAILFHEHVHVIDRSDIEIADKAADLLRTSYGTISPRSALMMFVPLGRAIGELKANFRMRDFMRKEKKKGAKYSRAFKKEVDQHLVKSLKKVNNQLLQLAMRLPAALGKIRKICVESIRKEFKGVSKTSRDAINKVLRNHKIPEIK